jgi:hypothetical protein
VLTTYSHRPNIFVWHSLRNWSQSSGTCLSSTGNTAIIILLQVLRGVIVVDSKVLVTNLRVTNLRSTERQEPIECKRRKLGRSVREEQEFRGHVAVLSGLSDGSVASVLSRLNDGSVGSVAQRYKRTFISHVTRKDLFRRSYSILLSLLVSLIYLSHLKYRTSQLRFPIIIRSFT